MSTLRQKTLSVVVLLIQFLRKYFPWLWAIFDVISLTLVDALRLFCGRWTASGLSECKRPTKPLVIYEFEACPFCRKVRETLSVLDIDHYVFPCPRETVRQAGYCLNSRYRPEVGKLGGSVQFPFLMDPNNGKQVYESDHIISYLWDTYGSKAKAPWNYNLAHWTPYRNFSMKMTAFCRPCMDMGLLRAASHKPEQPLELWGYESSPFVRRVRELLSCLETPYLYHEMPWGANKKRDAFKTQHKEKFGQLALRDKFNLIQVPFLVDPNTKTELFESSDIVDYLQTKYQTRAVGEESWMEYGIDEGKKKLV